MKKRIEMNERIKELADLADKLADDTLQMVGEFHPNWHEVRDQKFAELIIKDCADCIRENYNHESAESIAFQMDIKYGLHTDYGDHS